MTGSKKQKNNLLIVSLILIVITELLYEEDYVGRKIMRMGVQG